MEFLLPSAETYAAAFTTALDPALAAIEQQTTAAHPHAHMLSGHIQGIFLEMISRMISPENILEIGTFTGFSAVCLAKGLKRGGRLDTIEIRHEDAETAIQHIGRAGFTDRVFVHTGDAREIIPQLEQQWDLVFIDADKVSYIEYYELTLPLLKPGGWLIADNVLFHGQVLEAELKGKNAKAIQAFNEHVAADKRVEQVLLTVRDGLLIIRKL